MNWWTVPGALSLTSSEWWLCVYMFVWVCVCGDSLPCELLSEHHYWYSIIYLPVSATNVCIKYTSTYLLHAGCVFGHRYFPTVFVIVPAWRRCCHYGNRTLKWPGKQTRLTFFSMCFFSRSCLMFSAFSGQFLFVLKRSHLSHSLTVNCGVITTTTHVAFTTTVQVIRQYSACARDDSFSWKIAYFTDLWLMLMFKPICHPPPHLSGPLTPEQTMS